MIVLTRMKKINQQISRFYRFYLVDALQLLFTSGNISSGCRFVQIDRLIHNAAAAGLLLAVN
ncbi:MAG: hypothetical protein ACRYF5_02495 [Janthinobacterium lividum]